MLCRDVLGKLADHAGSGSPDERLLPRDPIDGVTSVRPWQAQGYVLPRIQHVGEGDFEGLGHLVLAQGQPVAWASMARTGSTS